jgi:hypothetical protein
MSGTRTSNGQKPAAAAGKPAAKSKAKTSVSNAVTVDPKQPIPFEYGGNTFSYVHGTRYLPFLPPNDNYAQLLLEARLLSTTHNACVVTKRNYCAGIGFQDRNGKELAEELLQWFEAINRKNENEVDINKKILESHFTWGNTPIEIVRLTVTGKKRLFIYVHNFMEWRLEKPDADGIVHNAIQSKLFLRQNILTPDEIKNAKILPLYNPLQPEKKNWIRDEKGTERTLIWFKNPMAGFDYYGMASAVASMIFQLLEYKGARYDLDNFENNMVISAILALKGNMSPEEVTRIGKQIIDTHTGDGKRGRLAVVASEEGIDGSEFHSFETSKEGSYIQADEKWMQKIILANDWDAILAGILSPSTLGKGSGFITKILEMKMNSVIRPVQSDLMKQVWRHIFRIAQEWLNIPFDQYALEIRNAIDISGLTDVDITPAVTRNEVRKAKGLPEDPSDKGNEYMKGTGPQQPNPEAKGGNNV